MDVGDPLRMGVVWGIRVVLGDRYAELSGVAVLEAVFLPSL